jgi:hypothetical protein
MLQSNQALVTWIQRQYQLCYTDKVKTKLTTIVANSKAISYFLHCMKLHCMAVLAGFLQNCALHGVTPVFAPYYIA